VRLATAYSFGDERFSADVYWSLGIAVAKGEELVPGSHASTPTPIVERLLLAFAVTSGLVPEAVYVIHDPSGLPQVLHQLVPVGDVWALFARLGVA
jgi:hypothetical protein